MSSFTYPDSSSLTCANRQLETSQYKPALSLIDTLLTELKRLDDKMILTEVHLLESRVYRGIGNLAKAKVHCNHLPAHSVSQKLTCSLGCSHISTNSGQLHLLPTAPASTA